MESRSTQIRALKEVFLKAKNAKRDKDGIFLDLNLQGEIFEAFDIVGRENLFELKDEIYSFLKDPCEDFREEAVKTLGWNTRLNVEEFCKKEAFEIFLNDPDSDVKACALNAWATTYFEEKNPKALQILYEILKDENYDSIVRFYALYDIFRISFEYENTSELYEFDELGEVEDPKEFTEAVDWERIHKIMKKYNVPVI